MDSFSRLILLSEVIIPYEKCVGFVVNRDECGGWNLTDRLTQVFFLPK
jgi:hypothetical protein